MPDALNAITAVSPTTTRMTRGLTLLFAVAAGAAVGNLYWAQPLLGLIGHDLGVSNTSAALLLTITQLGYAVGIVLLVPLGDLRNRRRLVPAILVASAVALAACAAAPGYGALLAALALLGVTTVSGQIIVPLAGDMAAPGEQGRVVGTVVSGVLTGILLSRTISGLVAGATSWRVLYAAAAVLALGMAFLLHRAIPDLPPKTSLRYPALLGSVATLIARERTVRWSLLTGAIQFGSFTMFWTALTFLLSGSPFDYSVDVIGLFGLVGLAGAVAAQRSGRLLDRGLAMPATGIGWVLAIAGFGLTGLATISIAFLIAGILLIDIAIQSLNILNQTRLFAVRAEARSRLNTAMVTTNFIAGAIGSAIASVLWSAGGWAAVTTTGVGLGVAGLLMWTLGRRGPLQVPITAG